MLTRAGTVPLGSDNPQALRRAVAPPFQVDHGDSLVPSESMILPSRWLSSNEPLYNGQFSGYDYAHSFADSLPSPELMSCSQQEASDLLPDSAWDDLHLCSTAMNHQGDPSLKTIHPKPARRALLIAIDTQRVTAQLEDIAYSLCGLFNCHLPIIYVKRHNVFGRHLQDIVSCSSDITALDWPGLVKYFKSGHGLQGDITSVTSHKAAPSIPQKSVDRHVLKCMQRAEHYRARYQLNCRRNLQRRYQNTRHHNTRHHTRYSQPAHNTEACQITLYITAKTTHHGVRSPCVHPLADARSVK